MKIYLKTCSLYEVRKAVEYSLIDGISLLPEDGEEKCVAADNDAKSIISCVSGPIFIPACGGCAEDILNDSLQLLRLSPNTVVSIKATLEGFKTCKLLSSKDVSVKMSGLNSVTKAIMAAKSGANFLSFNMNAVQQKYDEDFSILPETLSLIRIHDLSADVLAEVSDGSVNLNGLTGMGINGIELPFQTLMQFMENDS